MSATCSLIIITPGKSQGKRTREEIQRKTKKKKNFDIFIRGIGERLIATFLEKLKMCRPLFELCFVGLCRSWNLDI